MKCVSCGKELEPGWSVCPYCATPVQHEDEKEAIDTDYPVSDTENAPAPTEAALPSSHADASSLAATPSVPLSPSPAPTAASTITPAPPVKEVRSSMPKLTTTFLLLALLLLLLEGGGIIYYFTSYHPGERNAEATAAARNILTATDNDPQTFYQRVTSAAPAISDDLSSEEKSAWSSDTSNPAATCTFQKGGYHALVTQQKLHSDCILASFFGNFALQVQLTILKGDKAEILFRYDPSNQQFYHLLITPQGDYEIDGYDTFHGQRTLKKGHLRTFKTGFNQPNLVALLARNNTFFIYINKQFAVSFSDEAYTLGVLSLSAIDTTSPTEVVYNNAEVWNV